MTLTLVGDGIENPWNARAMLHAAAMFGADCRFRDRVGLAGAWRAAGLEEAPPLVGRDELVATYRPLIALDNVPGASDIYGFPTPPGPSPALVAGNERRGLAHDIVSTAHAAVQIPMASRTLDTLNVAAASAVALYYLARGGGGRLQTSVHPRKRRPELFIVGGPDHVELGSTIRSAGAFGWERIILEDRAGAWFERDRVTHAEGRAAARHHRNPIRLVPAKPSAQYAFEEVCVVTVRGEGVPLHRANLAHGPRQALVIPDESAVDVACEPWDRLGRIVRFVHLDLPRQDFAYHLRLIASIILAEAARQVSQRPRGAPARPASRPPVYDASLTILMDEAAETVYLEDLTEY